VAGPRPAGARPPFARSRHALRSSALAAELVRDACVGAGDLVLDLGAGSGRITAELARVARHVVAVELDPGLADRLRGRWANVSVVEGDGTLVRLPATPFRVVANLPFHRTNDGRPWPSTVNGVAWGALYETSIARRLPRHHFDPPPSVDAGVLVFRRRETPLVPLDGFAGYRRFVAGGFRRGLHAVAPARAVARVGGRGASARNLDAHQWAALYLRAHR
jgi:23S rRNA (adenine-N6)-dimethyltransferase